MASQQTLIAETIRSMKLAIKRRDDESDSDLSIRQHTNRGNKLKRKAHFVRSGRLDTTGGPSYKRRINYAGYDRAIIHQNPTLFDIDGDPVDPDEDIEDENISSVEDNPFGETKLEDLLMPLTSAQDLAEHPSLSVPYTTKHITEMAENAREMLHREREMLWKMKAYLQRFRGDKLWAPLGSLESVEDGLLLENDALGFFPEDASYHASASAANGSANGSAGARSPIPSMAKTNGTSHNQATAQIEDARTNGVAVVDMAGQEQSDIAQANGEAPRTTNGDAKETENTNGDRNEDKEHPGSPMDGITENGHLKTDEDDETPIAHAMTTRAKARTPPPSDGPRSPTPSDLGSLPSIAAFFMAPPTAIPDQSLGLPANEADDTRRLILLYVQKQEEVVRGTERLLHGLLRADRTRADVWAWCRAEPHVGELSDGEDWYDREHWGLEADLVKGKEEEEPEDEKQRRGRRRGAGGRAAAAA